MIIEGKSAEEVFQNIAKSIARAALEAALMGKGPLAGLFGGGGGLFGSLFGGIGGAGLAFNPTGRASGGPVYPGRAYTVGESGRETFVPTQPGRIIPKGKDSSAPPVNVNVINNAGAQVETRQGPGGSIDVMIDAVEARMGQRASQGRGSLFHSMKGRNLRG